MIRKGTRVIVLDNGPPPPSAEHLAGKVVSFIHWDRTYYRVLLDSGREITTERVRKETP